MQNRNPISTTLILLFICIAPSFAQNLKKADSLYSKRQFVQALDEYKAVLHDGHFSPAMLLKMAHIYEGSGDLANALLCLKQYATATGDELALYHMEELAEKNNLEGYTSSDNTRLVNWLIQHRLPISLSLLAVLTILLGVIFYEKFVQKTSPTAAFVLFFVLIAAFLVQVNLSKPARQVIVLQNHSALMSGPSSGAKLVALIQAGHQLNVKRSKDVWLQVEWKGQSAWIRDSRVAKAL